MCFCVVGVVWVVFWRCALPSTRSCSGFVFVGFAFCFFVLVRVGLCCCFFVLFMWGFGGFFFVFWCFSGGLNSLSPFWYVVYQLEDLLSVYFTFQRGVDGLVVVFYIFWLFWKGGLPWNRP